MVNRRLSISGRLVCLFSLSLLFCCLWYRIEYTHTHIYKYNVVEMVVAFLFRAYGFSCSSVDSKVSAFALISQDSGARSWLVIAVPILLLKPPDFVAKSDPPSAFKRNFHTRVQ